MDTFINNNDIGFLDLPVEIQLVILRNYDKSLWIASRSINTILRKASQNEFNKNELLYPPSKNELLYPPSKKELKLLINNGSINNFCIFKTSYNPDRSYRASTSFLMTKEKSFSYISSDTYGYFTFSLSSNYDIDYILPQNLNREVISIDTDYITFYYTLRKREININDSKRLTLEVFKKDIETCDFEKNNIITLKLLSHARLFDIDIKPFIDEINNKIVDKIQVRE